MKMYILFSFALLDTSLLLVSNEDSLKPYFWEYLTKNPASIFVIIVFVLYFIIIKPFVLPLLRTRKKYNKFVLIECIVSELPFVVFEQITENSKIITELKIGDNFYLNQNVSFKSYHEVHLKSGQIGYIKKTNNFENVVN
jgi:hypothetical protein